MARGRRKPPPEGSAGPAPAAGGDPGAGASGPADFKPGMLITFRPEGIDAGLARLRDAAGIGAVARAADFDDRAVRFAETEGSGLTLFDGLGVAVADMDLDRAAGVAAAAAEDGAGIAAIEPEPIFFAFADGLPPDLAAYLRGYRDAVDHLVGRLAGGTPPGGVPGMAGAEAFRDTPATTWGLAATRAASSRGTGRGVKVAVLDTGLDLDHPDFRGRPVAGRSFITGQAVQDDNGHGTHCAGTACGPRGPARGPRYGVAPEAELHVGKVLTNAGSALGRSTLAGIEWAVGAGCRIVSMSLGGRVERGQGHLAAFEATARQALRRGALIVAAAGNDSRRSQGHVRPVSSPANCPSILAVAAVGRELRTADFSNGAVNADGNVDLAGPGVDVLSSVPEPAAPRQPPHFKQWQAQYDTASGTSMATPHVAGVAALLLEENPSLTADELWRLLAARARNLPLPAGDVGAGLVQA